MVLVYALVVGIAPMILAFIAGFFGATIPIGWGAYIAWFALSIIVGLVVMFARRM